jgi:nucleoside 2-deoxyribosyltransferase
MTRLVCLEMVRDGDGRLTDLQPFQPPQAEDAGTSFESPLLDAFVDGYHAATARFN